MKLKKSKRPHDPGSKATTRTPPPVVGKILATTDFSAASRTGVQYAISLAEKIGAAVELLHVVEPHSWASGLGSGVPVRDDSAMVASARAQLATMAKGGAKAGVPVTGSVSVQSGNAFHAITTVAREHVAELIVIATHGYTGLERVLLGSTAERVVRHAPCPVLTVPLNYRPGRIGRPSAFRLRKILVPLDFSNLANDALPYATLLAAKLGAEVILLHVVEKFPIDYLLGGGLTNEVFVPMMKQAEADLEGIAQSLDDLAKFKISTSVREGSPYEEICHAAKALEVDLVVLTTHGYTGLKQFWLGSTAERVVRHSPCPVMSVRELDRKPMPVRSTGKVQQHRTAG